MTDQLHLDLCPVCGQRVALLAYSGMTATHVFTGDAPSVWLRPGERCPASGADPETWDDDKVPYQPPRYGEPGWPDDLFGGGRSYRRGRAVAEHRSSIALATGGNPSTSDQFWPHTYGPPPH